MFTYMPIFSIHSLFQLHHRHHRRLPLFLLLSDPSLQALHIAIFLLWYILHLLSTTPFGSKVLIRTREFPSRSRDYLGI